MTSDNISKLIKSGSLDMMQKIISDLIAGDAVRRNRIITCKKYLSDQHEITTREVSDTTKPNNKLVNDYPNKIVNTVVGYFVGNPVTYKHPDQYKAEAELLKKIRIANDEELHNERLARTFVGIGESFELLYVGTDADVTPKFALLDPEEVILVYDGSIENKVQYGLRKYAVTVDDVECTKIEWFDDQNCTHYLLTSDGLVYDMTKAEPIIPHYFGEVPIIEYRNNDLRFSDFFKSLPLIRDYDYTLSDMSNELDSFRNAYLKLKNLSGTTKEDLDKMKEMGAFLVDGEGDVSFITKEVNDGVVEHHFKKLDKNIHKFTDTPDMSDESFAGDLSGVAILYKLFALETKCKSKERYMKSGLRKRWRMINTFLGVMNASIEPDQMETVFARNLPPNVKEAVENAKALVGVVSQKTLLALLPFIEDVEAEIKQLKGEQDDEAAQYKELVKKYAETTTAANAGNAVPS